MQYRTLALATTSLVVLGFATASTAAAQGIMGDVSLGYAHNWHDYDFGAAGGFDIEYPAIMGSGRVNVPYDDNVNIQLDVVGRSSMDDSFFSGKNIVSDTSYFGIGGHINYRDDDGMLGVFAATGRVHDLIVYGAPVYLAGIEGQYYCDEWTFRGQIGYLDADESLLLKNAGMIRSGVTYYSGNKFKISADVAYLNGEVGSSFFLPFSVDAEEWAWSVGVDYWFGKSIPVSGFAEYRGREVEADYGALGSPDLEHHSVNFGLRFHFGAEGFPQADREGPSGDLPDLDWYRLNPIPTGP